MLLYFKSSKATVAHQIDLSFVWLKTSDNLWFGLYIHCISGGLLFLSHRMGLRCFSWHINDPINRDPLLPFLATKFPDLFVLHQRVSIANHSVQSQGCVSLYLPSFKPTPCDFFSLDCLINSSLTKLVLRALDTNPTDFPFSLFKLVRKICLA